MGDVKPSVSTTNNMDGNAIEARFTICASLNKQRGFGFRLSYKRLSEKSGGNAEQDIVDFFRELPQFMAKAAPVLINMSYKRAFWELFLSSDANIQENTTGAPDYFSVPTIWVVTVFGAPCALCKWFCFYTEIRVTASIALYLYCISVSMFLDGLIYFEGLLEEQSFSSNLSILEKDYDDAIRSDLDERLFINDQGSLLGFGCLSGGDENINGIKRKFDSIASPSKTISSPLSPHSYCASCAMLFLGQLMERWQLRLSAAMTTAKWLLLATHKTATMLFPTVLDRTGVTPFDLSKVIENFIRHEDLYQETEAASKFTGERLLESMVKMWMSGLRRLCTDYRSVLVERNSFTSPVKDRLLGFSNLRKINKLAAVRINDFQLEFSFKKIVGNYKKQPQWKPEVYSSVFVDRSSTQQNGNNKKTSQVPETNNSNDGPCPGSPKVTSFPSLPDMSPMKVSAKHNVMCLHCEHPRCSNLHSSRSYYACVGESTRAFQIPSKDLTAINNHLKGIFSSLFVYRNPCDVLPKLMNGSIGFDGCSRRTRVALNFDDVEVGLVSDSMVANSLYLENGSHAAALKSEQPESWCQHMACIPSKFCLYVCRFKLYI
ncbi:hypothetical protein F3Y22_tig00110204pilonHSYRG00086 [Hibiscus syriacus]|uniref:Retinoblastoma-associated protein A-box domain-containing protein n=1 Tax=Hibiscus syriacus TaxID=106335 RepID=A0A6A3BBE7_HIBSY|nr:hypothetical protein F3Y22_tig00110204pilonHSYRG00086 [Hibiscus syriacus]